MFLEKERFVWPLQVEFCLIVGSEQAAAVENFCIVFKSSVCKNLWIN